MNLLILGPLEVRVDDVLVPLGGADTFSARAGDQPGRFSNACLSSVRDQLVTGRDNQ